MKKYAGVMVVLCVVSLAYGVCGKSFFLFKPSFEFTDPERRVFLDVYGHKGMFEVTVFGGSTCESEKIARYFLPVEQSCIRVIEDGSHNFLSADVTAGYMNVVSVPLQNKTSAQLQDLIGDMTYESVAYFRPKRTEIGVGFAMRYRFSSQCWFTVATSVVQLKHRLNICENIVSTGGPGPDVGYGYKTLWAMINAGCPQWRYGKFYGGCLKKTGFPEVELCLGHDHDHEDTGTTSGFLGVSIPTGSQACQCYMFEPVVGNNRHVGILGGVVGDYGVMQTETLDFRAVLCGLLRYTCPKKELRSFDVRGAPWSRYMLV
jgi:hypothetical protein